MQTSMDFSPRAVALACWPVAALVLVVAAPSVIAAGWWLHTWSEREARG